jgi:hypothetical protein
MVFADERAYLVGEAWQANVRPEIGVPGSRTACNDACVEISRNDGEVRSPHISAKDEAGGLVEMNEGRPTSTAGRRVQGCAFSYNLLSEESIYDTTYRCSREARAPGDGDASEGSVLADQAQDERIVRLTHIVEVRSAVAHNIGSDKGVAPANAGRDAGV